jgi:hypothetical protein
VVLVVASMLSAFAFRLFRRLTKKSGVREGAVTLGPVIDALTAVTVGLSSSGCSIWYWN